MRCVKQVHLRLRLPWSKTYRTCPEVSVFCQKIRSRVRGKSVDAVWSHVRFKSGTGSPPVCASRRPASRVRRSARRWRGLPSTPGLCGRGKHVRLQRRTVIEQLQAQSIQKSRTTLHERLAACKLAGQAKGQWKRRSVSAWRVGMSLNKLRKAALATRSHRCFPAWTVPAIRCGHR